MMVNYFSVFIKTHIWFSRFDLTYGFFTVDHISQDLYIWSKVQEFSYNPLKTPVIINDLYTGHLHLRQLLSVYSEHTMLRILLLVTLVYWSNAKGAGNALVLGTAGGDNLNGGKNRDCIVGGGGNDNIQGKGGDDVLIGGSGDDSLDGGKGNDECHGGSGTDTNKGNRCETTTGIP